MDRWEVARGGCDRAAVSMGTKEFIVVEDEIRFGYGCACPRSVAESRIR